MRFKSCSIPETCWSESFEPFDSPPSSSALFVNRDRSFVGKALAVEATKRIERQNRNVELELRLGRLSSFLVIVSLFRLPVFIVSCLFAAVCRLVDGE